MELEDAPFLTKKEINLTRKLLLLKFQLDYLHLSMYLILIIRQSNYKERNQELIWTLKAMELQDFPSRLHRQRSGRRWPGLLI